MGIFSKIYLALSKKKFHKSFKPLSKRTRHNFLISAPDNIAEFLRIMPYIAGLKNIGTMVMLVPQSYRTLCGYIKPKIFEFVFYEIFPEVLSKEHNALKEQLSRKRFHYIIDLNKPAKISLVYLTDAERRISFYNQEMFPYYNIMLRDSIKSLCDFFALQKTDPRKLLKFYVRNIKNALKKFNIKPPILFVNGSNSVTWQGDRIVMGKDIAVDDPDAYNLLIGADAYSGQHDVFFELAKILAKEIIV